MAWKHTGRKRSPAQTRQQHLFMKKGQLSGMLSVLGGIMTDPILPEGIRYQARLASHFIKNAVDTYDKEVGWK